MVRTYGLTHINLVVRDVERSLRFYGQVFGVEEYGRTEGLVHTRTPGCQDVITFDEQTSGAGESRGIVGVVGAMQGQQRVGTGRESERVEHAPVEAGSRALEQVAHHVARHVHAARDAFGREVADGAIAGAAQHVGGRRPASGSGAARRPSRPRLGPGAR